MEKKYQDYIDRVIDNINGDKKTKDKIRQSLNEHIDIMIEKHGSLAYKELESPIIVAQEFSENLGLNEINESERKPGSFWWQKIRFPRKVSSKKIFNLPLYHITDGYNPETDKFEVAKGIFAYGPVAVGVFSFGAVSLGLISFGAISIGLLFALGGLALSLLAAIGGLAVAGLLAMGGAAISFGLSFGGIAIGHVAIGDYVIGEYVYDVNAGEGNADQWFREHMPYFLRYFQ